MISEIEKIVVVECFTNHHRDEKLSKITINKPDTAKRKLMLEIAYKHASTNMNIILFVEKKNNHEKI